MSLTASVGRMVSRPLAFVALVLCSATSSSAQFPQRAAYVCQTPTFWCAFQAVAGAPDGSACYCNTIWGPVGGASITPAGVSTAAKFPTPQTLPSRRKNPPPTNPGKVDTDECYKGLGNCPGSFTSSASGGTSTSGDGRTGGDRTTTSAFASAVQKIVDAVEHDFDDIRGDARGGSNSTDYYDVTLVPEGMRRCTLFVPEGSSRKPWVTCWPSERLSYSQLVDSVGGAVGNVGSSSFGTRTWMIGNVGLRVYRDSPMTLEIYPARNSR